MLEVALIILVVVLALSLAIAYAFIKRSKSILGVLLGVVPIAFVYLAFIWYFNAGIQECNNYACARAGLPPGCGITDSICGEWSALGLFLSCAAGLLSLGLYVIGVSTIAILHSRRKHTPSKSPPGGSSAAA